MRDRLIGRLRRALASAVGEEGGGDTWRSPDAEVMAPRHKKAPRPTVVNAMTPNGLETPELTAIEALPPAITDVSQPVILQAYCPMSFDESWYKQLCPQLSSSGLTAWQHFDRIGWKIGLDPCQYFWCTWYLTTNPDVADAKVNPLVHYELFGSIEGRRPSPLFDGRWYASVYGIDVRKVQPLAHFLWHGSQKGYAPRADAVAESFHSGAVTARRRAFWLQNLADKAGQTGVNAAYFEGPLCQGHTFFPLTGAEFFHHSALEEIGQHVADEGIDLAPSYCVSANQVYVFPGTTSLVCGETIVNDEIASRPMNDVSGGREKSEGVWRKGGRVTIEYKPSVAPRLERGIHLFKEYERNYFHFMTELMPKLVLVEHLGLKSNIPLLMCDDLDARLYAVVDHLKHPDRNVIRLKRDVPHLVDRLIYLSDVALVKDVYNAVPLPEHCFLPHRLIADMTRLLKSRIATGQRRSRKLYVSRRSDRRKLLNEAALTESLIRLDFDVITPDDLSFDAQVELFSSADTVVGATGAAFTNIMWCAPGTKVIIMYPDHPFNNTTFWDQLGKIGDIDVSYVLGTRAQRVQGIYSMHDDFSVDPNELRAVLE